MNGQKRKSQHGDSLVQYPEIEKIGLVEWFEVRKHSRALYVLLNPVDVRLHDIQVGDRLRMKIEWIRRTPRDTEE